jgi:hypothetical protein
LGHKRLALSVLDATLALVEDPGALAAQLGGAVAPEASPAICDEATFEHALRVAEALILARDRPVKAERLQIALPMRKEMQ